MQLKSYHIFLLLVMTSCREKFVPRINSPATGYLVVEGIINSGTGPTNILLSRSNKLSVDSLQYEEGASVQVEGNDNSVNDLAYAGNGFYNSAQLNLNNTLQYRIRIKTKDGKEYLSDFAGVKTTPPIDSVRWHYGNDGVNISVSAHDPQNNTRYYYWDYQETWEYHSTYTPSCKVIRVMGGQRIIRFPSDPSLYACWDNAHSFYIFLGSSAKLEDDIIDSMPIVFIPRGSAKIGVLYSVLIRQYALTSDAYEFLQRMRKNTEQTGSVFDAQPSELKGNIHCTSNPSELVLGYLNVCSEETKRIFIYNRQVPNWNYDPECPLDIAKGPIEITQYLAAQRVPVDILDSAGPTVLQASFTLPKCVDCTLTGSNQKPPFWP